MGYPPDREDSELLEGLGADGGGQGDETARGAGAPYLASRGLEANVEAAANRSAYLPGKASNLAEQAPRLAPGEVDAKAGIAATTLRTAG